MHFKKQYKNAKKPPTPQEKTKAIKKIRRQIRADSNKKQHANNKGDAAGSKKKTDNIVVVTADELSQLAVSNNYRCKISWISLRARR
jgi:hypothetical protein